MFKHQKRYIVTISFAERTSRNKESDAVVCIYNTQRNSLLYRYRISSNIMLTSPALCLRPKSLLRRPFDSHVRIIVLSIERCQLDEALTLLRVWVIVLLSLSLSLCLCVFPCEKQPHCLRCVHRHFCSACFIISYLNTAGFSLSRALFRKNVGPLPTIRIPPDCIQFTRHKQWVLSSSTFW